MKKILIISTVSRQFYLFEQGNIEVLKSLGFEVHCAANFEDENERLDALDIVRHHFDIQRSPFSIKNIKAYKQLKKIMKSENFDAVHCHSPMGGVLARLAARAIGIKKVIYTAHGFHFYEGAPIKNWIIYYTVEKILSRFTDVLITINQEDYERARKFKAKKAVYVPGIGIDTEKLSRVVVNKNKKREDLGFTRDAFIILSVGELNENKNHEVIIKALARLKNPNIKYIICGKGSLEDYLGDLIKKFEVEEQVKLLGFRNDISEICIIVDLFVFPSYREGLSVSLMEAMVAGLPCVISKVRGNLDLIEDGVGGFLRSPEDVEGFAEAINTLANDEDLREIMRYSNIKKIKRFDVENVKVKMKKIYEEVLINGE